MPCGWLVSKDWRPLLVTPTLDVAVALCGAPELWQFTGYTFEPVTFEPAAEDDE